MLTRAAVRNPGEQKTLPVELSSQAHRRGGAVPMRFLNTMCLRTLTRPAILPLSASTTHDTLLLHRTTLNGCVRSCSSSSPRVHRLGALSTPLPPSAPLATCTTMVRLASTLASHPPKCATKRNRALFHPNLPSPCPHGLCASIGNVGFEKKYCIICASSFRPTQGFNLS